MTGLLSLVWQCEGGGAACSQFGKDVGLNVHYCFLIMWVLQECGARELKIGVCACVYF